ncbi:MAG: hypothetical protein K2I30_03905 [Clostridia bacterium]|nr:hypothetical protein [Clostridia bacterium]
MDFFKYASVVSEFNSAMWVQFLTGGLCFAIVFVFQSIALYVIAGREGYKHKWMAFIPFVNTYYIGVCSQKNKFYTIDTKIIGLISAIVEFLVFSLYVLYFAALSLVLSYEVPIETTTTIFGMQYNVTMYELANVPERLGWAAWIYNNMHYILNVGNVVFTILKIILLISFFRTYACRRAVLFTFTSILFPIQGILFFTVCKNRGVNYSEYMRAEQAKIYRMYQQQQQQNFDRNPYSRNPYSGTPYDDFNGGGSTNNGGNAPEDPFGDLGGGGGNGNGGSPFDDFNN